MNNYKPAGFWIRLGASLLDYLIISLPILLIFWLLTGKDPDESTFISVIMAVYSILLPVLWNGYVVGKKICGIRIVKKDGSQVGILAMVLRVIVGGIIYTLTFGIAAIVSAFMVGLREDKRSIHDFVAGTYVTYAEPSETEINMDEQSVKSE
ncbi:RDD family protein [Bacillus atrophaeus]|uniref:RDD family protein n=1 Tax=Bacillus atrophaeus TaxID=1452 RepID=UPI001C624A1A|nr:RDD family protein [Bacillus atrophaeus]MCY7945006.1 RDD family protein [Bacillus atrophaeus]MCY8094960.1 RDD family protein [Bacillus atrophaeus]MCY9170630.1 RDD family protein [Bacillus atrophaeus]MEC0742992.1 RDD family protein [Bacillus atrophaeus]MEC0747584.1 RDD family protein [Bacillus atrophaeus]